MNLRLALGVVIACAAAAAAAQQLYRWTDAQGRVHVTDTPPPPGAKGVTKVKPAAAPAASPSKPQPPTPFVLQRALKEYPVTLYSSPTCLEPCAAARGLLNKRGVPFKEVQVWDEEGNAELKKVAGQAAVPTLKVGASVHTGFEASAYDALLDSAGYPGAGVLPAGQQAAPGRPEGYVPPEEREPPRAEPVKPEAGTPGAGPSSPGAKPQPRPKP